MIQNIQFPEGTNVTYQKGGSYDQFNKNMNIKPNIASNFLLSQGLYIYSNLYSAKEFINMPMDYCFYASNCIFRVNDTKSLFHTFDTGYYMYDLILDKNIPVSLDYTFNGAEMLSFFTISANATNINNIMGGYDSSVAKYVTWDIDTSELTSLTTPFTQYIKALFGLF